MDAIAHRSSWKTLLAFAIIYFVWGSTFLAIRVASTKFRRFFSRRCGSWSRAWFSMAG